MEDNTDLRSTLIACCDAYEVVVNLRDRLGEQQRDLNKLREALAESYQDLYRQMVAKGTSEVIRGIHKFEIRGGQVCRDEFLGTVIND